MAEDKKVPVHVRYVGGGKQFFIGIPARDLTKAEYDRLDLGQKRDVDSSDIYEVVAPEKNAPAKTNESENK